MWRIFTENLDSMAVLWFTAEFCDGPEVLEYFLSVCHGPEPYMTAPNGQLVFTFSELQGCARCVSQTENGFFMVRAPQLEMESIIPPLRTLADCERIGYLIIHAFDFSFWEVTTEDDKLNSEARKQIQTDDN